MKILVCGLPGSGKSTLAELLSKSLLTAVWINADEVRDRYDDWDFTPEGRMRQSRRMTYISDGVVRAGGIAIADFIAPTQSVRDQYDADYVIWLDTITEGRFEDTNAMFEKVRYADYVVTEQDAVNQIVGIITDMKVHFHFIDPVAVFGK
jgi:adenylylsulfate kinase